MTHWDRGNPTAADAIERQSSRPDLVILCYPVVSMSQPFTHRGSRANLLGDHPSPELQRELSAELRVSTNTPPCFIWSTADDRTVPVENSLTLALALSKVGCRSICTFTRMDRTESVWETKLLISPNFTRGPGNVNSGPDRTISPSETGPGSNG